MKKDLVSTMDELIPDVMLCDMYSINKIVKEDIVIWEISSPDRVSIDTVYRLFDGVLSKIHVDTLKPTSSDYWCCDVYLHRGGVEHVWDGDMVRSEVVRRKKEILRYETECKKAYS